MVQHRKNKSFLEPLQSGLSPRYMYHAETFVCVCVCAQMPPFREGSNQYFASYVFLSNRVF